MSQEDRRLVRLEASAKDAPEDVAKLICDDNCPPGTREQDLGRFFRDFSARVMLLGRECEWNGDSRFLEGNVNGPYRSLKGCRLSIAQTFNCLSSPAVAKCVYSESTAAQRTGPALSTASSCVLSSDTVEQSSSPELRFSSRQVSEGSIRSVLGV